MQLNNKTYNIIELEETGSTNQYLRDILSKSSPVEETVVTTEFQTRGRGQMGNSWNSEKGKNLLFSILLYPTMVEPIKQFIISRIISVAIHRVLSQFTDGIKIKWPNDIYHNNNKIAGILIENSLMGKAITYSIVGVGMNIAQKSFSDNIPNPVSLTQITGMEHSRADILDSVLREFFFLYEEMKNNNVEKIEQEYFQNLFQRGETCLYKDERGEFRGKIVDVLPSGHLVMETESETEKRKYAFKEVQFIIEK